jgi:hypothetical protein
MNLLLTATVTRPIHHGVIPRAQVMKTQPRSMPTHVMLSASEVFAFRMEKKQILSASPQNDILSKGKIFQIVPQNSSKPNLQRRHEEVLIVATPSFSLLLTSW